MANHQAEKSMAALIASVLEERKNAGSDIIAVVYPTESTNFTVIRDNGKRFDVTIREID